MRRILILASAMLISMSTIGAAQQSDTHPRLQSKFVDRFARDRRREDGAADIDTHVGRHLTFL